MTEYLVCGKCNRPIFENASDTMLSMGAICTCSTLARQGSRWIVHKPDSPKGGSQPIVQKTAQGKAVPDLEELYLDILAEHAPDLPKPLRQQEVIQGRGFKVDFFWSTRFWAEDEGKGLVVEIDGNVHRIKQRFLSDAEKHNLIVLAGYTYLRFTGQMLRHKVADVIRQTREGLERAKGVKAI